MFQMTQQGNNIFQFRSIYKYIFYTDPREITPNIASTPHDITQMVRYSHSIPTWNILSIHNFQKYSPLANLNHTARKSTIFSFSLLNGLKHTHQRYNTLTKWPSYTILDNLCCRLLCHSNHGLQRKCNTTVYTTGRAPLTAWSIHQIGMDLYDAISDSLPRIFLSKVKYITLTTDHRFNRLQPITYWNSVET